MYCVRPSIETISHVMGSCVLPSHHFSKNDTDECAPARNANIFSTDLTVCSVFFGTSMASSIVLTLILYSVCRQLSHMARNPHKNAQSNTTQPPCAINQPIAKNGLSPNWVTHAIRSISKTDDGADSSNRSSMRLQDTTRGGRWTTASSTDAASRAVVTR